MVANILLNSIILPNSDAYECRKQASTMLSSAKITLVRVVHPPHFEYGVAIVGRNEMGERSKVEAETKQTGGGKRS